LNNDGFTPAFTICLHLKKCLIYTENQEMSDGVIILEPRELTVPFQVSSNTLSMMDESIENLKKGKVSAPIDLSEFEE